MHTRDQIAILEDEFSELQRGAVRVEIRMLQKDEGNDGGVLPALAEKNEVKDWYCCDCGVKKFSHNPKSQNPILMKQACSSCGAKESWGRLKGGHERARTMARTSAELGEEPEPFVKLPRLPAPAIVPALAEYRSPAPGKSPALAEQDEVTDWYCCMCGVKQSQKPFDLSFTCSACVAPQSFFAVHGYKRQRTIGTSPAEPPALESITESLNEAFEMHQACFERVCQKFAKMASPNPSTISAVAGTSPEPSDPDTQNSPDTAAFTSRMDAEEATVQHTSPFVAMPSPVVFDLTDEMTGFHDDTQN